MATIKQFNARFQKINFKKSVMESVRLTAFDILELNKSEGLEKGLLSNGNPVLPKYASPLYVVANNKPGFNPNLKLTGAFYRGFFITLGTYSFKIDSNDSKAGDLEAKYSKYIYGLNANGIRRYIPILYPKLITNIKATAGM